MWVKDVLRFCYLNIPCLRINSTLIFMSSSNDELECNQFPRGVIPYKRLSGDVPLDGVAFSQLD